MAATSRRTASQARKSADADGVLDAPDSQKKAIVDALLVEREGYVRRGLNARVKQVDAQLKAHDAKAPASSSTGSPAGAGDDSGDTGTPADTGDDTGSAPAKK